MNLSQFLAILRARWWVAAIVFGLTVATTLAVSLLLPKRYAATATLLVDVKTPDPIAGMLFPSIGLPGYMATQVEILESMRVSERVVKLLKLADNPQVREQWLDATGGKGNLESWLASTFKKNIDGKPSREANVITVTYTGQDPRFSAALANAYVQAFLETSVELRNDPARQYSSFFDGRAKELRDAVEKAQAKLSTFQRENSLVANDERLDIETSRLNELSTQLVMMQAAAAESQSRTSQANSASGEKMQEVLNNGVVAALKTDISRAEARLKELNSRLGDNHPQVIEAKASIAELRSRMDAEIRRVTGGVGVSNTIVRARESDVRAALDAQRTKVLKLKGLRDEVAVLQRDVEAAQRAYDSVTSRRAQTSLESQANQTNISVLAPASEPGEASSPKVLLNTALSVVVGALLGLGAALLVELIDRRVRTVGDAAESFGLPLLGVLPGPAPRRGGAGRVPLLQQRILGQLPSPAEGGA